MSSFLGITVINLDGGSIVSCKMPKTALTEAIAEDIQPGMRIERDGSWEEVLSVDPVRDGTQIETISGIYTLNGLFKVASTTRSTPPEAV
jgi:hypothetical protein